MILVNDSILSNLQDSANNNFEALRKRIDDFQVIILYDRQQNHFDYHYLVNFPSEKIKKKVRNEHIFPRIKSETFIIWQHAYKENKDLFYKLRLRARNEMLQRLTEFMVAKFFSMHENELTPLLKNKPTLKWELLNKVFKKYETLLKENTRLDDEEAWEGFSKWFKQYLQHHIIHEMIRLFGEQKLMTMEQEALNQLFFQCMNNNLADNDHFMNEFTNVVNRYLANKIDDFVGIPAIENQSIFAFIEELKMGHEQIEVHDFKASVKNNYLIVMSNTIYQFIIEAISNKQFQKVEDSAWPTAMIANHLVNGRIQLIPLKTDGSQAQFTNLEQALWQRVEGLSELDVDIMDVICHLYLESSTHRTTEVSIQLDELLMIRGLKPKLGGSGRRGGYEATQREQVLKALSIMQDLWVEIEQVTLFENGRRVKKALQGRAFHLTDIHGNALNFNEFQVQDKLFLNIGDLFYDFLKGSNRQVKLLPKQAIQYNPYQKKWEKKLMRYLSWRWRTQARKGSYLQPHKINTLLEKLGTEMNVQTPSRIRDRLEKALDTLLSENVIRFWQYESWDENQMMKKGWLTIWKEATVLISPADEIMKYYQPLERRQTKKAPKNRALLSEAGRNDEVIGEKLKQKRAELGLTLQGISHELAISPSYLSNIERGNTIPSDHLYRRIHAWLS